jgi:nicotinate phosphoribosyltransferase
MVATGFLGPLYGGSLALLTDLYQLTMAHGYWANGIAEQEAVFHLFFRKSPFAGGYAVCAGLGPALEHLARLRFTDEDLAYLASLGLFQPGFLDYLRTFELALIVDAVPEGRVVFPHEPLVRVQGPLLAAQLVETALLTLVNFETLVATKAARVCHAAGGAPVVDFGLRRAQGPDGGVGASRAAYIGGVEATSNVLAGKLFGIPVRGTHAHSWVMSFESEEESFRAYASALPNNSIFLVDTYDTLQGVARAIESGRWLRSQGHKLGGIRLDSGDLAYLSIEARRLLNEAGFPEAAILASNDLDEHTIASLKQQGAAINVWGVGTKLVTAYDQPALGGVYKLSAIRDPGGTWQHKVKLSEQSAKVSTPGLQQVRRFRRQGTFIGDMIYNLDGPPEQSRTIVDRLDATRRKLIPEDAESEDLLVPIFRQGELAYERPPIVAVRERAKTQLAALHEGHKRFLNPHEYPVGLSPALHELRTQLILTARGLHQLNTKAGSS